MMKKMAIGIALLALAIPAHGDITTLYQLKHDNAVKKANVEHRAAVLAAKRALIIDLKAAMKRALVAEKTRDALKIATKIDIIEGEIKGLITIEEGAAIEAKAKAKKKAVVLDHDGKWIQLRKGVPLFGAPLGNRASKVSSSYRPFFPVGNFSFWQAAKQSSAKRPFEATAFVYLLVPEFPNQRAGAVAAHYVKLQEKVLNEGWKNTRKVITLIDSSHGVQYRVYFQEGTKKKPVKGTIHNECFLMTTGTPAQLNAPKPFFKPMGK